MTRDQFFLLMSFINERVLLERFTSNCDSVSEKAALSEVDRIFDELHKTVSDDEQLKWEYCKLKGADSITGLDSCDDYKDWRDNKLNNVILIRQD